jgi:hypothetical protein
MAMKIRRRKGQKEPFQKMWVLKYFPWQWLTRLSSSSARAISQTWLPKGKAALDYILPKAPFFQMML